LPVTQQKQKDKNLSYRYGKQMKKIKIINRFGDFNWKTVSILSAFAGIFAVLGFMGLDFWIFSLLRSYNIGVWYWFDMFGNWKVVLAATIVLFGASRLLGEKKFQMAFGNATVAIVAAMFVTGVMKIAFGRMRPFMFEALGETEFRPLSLSNTFHSFPSGHTAAALALLVSIGIIFPKVRWATWGLSVVVALSRIAIGAHWPSDVVIGALIGTGAAYFVIYVRKKYLAYLLEKRQK